MKKEESWKHGTNLKVSLLAIHADIFKNVCEGTSLWEAWNYSAKSVSITWIQ
jgi:hypothetical protein